MISRDQLREWFIHPTPIENLADQIRRSPSTPSLMDALRRIVPDLTNIPHTTYTCYREFERSGARDSYQTPYFQKRAMLTRAVLEMVMGDESDAMRNAVHDLLWNVCEETSWALPAHEEQGPDYWDIDPPIVRTWPLGAYTMLTREPDSMDLFAAETGAALAEALYLLGPRIEPEVRQRVKQEVERRIFRPYLHYGRRHWWYKGALNWNGVCNGSVGLAFLRLEQDLDVLSSALAMVLGGFDAYIATGFEADGGSIEGVGYWNYGLMYYVTVAELLREISGGQLDLLAGQRMREIARYAPGMALTPNTFINFGDATEMLHVAPGIVARLAERTGVDELRSLLAQGIDEGSGSVAKLPIVARRAAWWDGREAPPLPHRDFYLPHVGVAKLTASTATGKPVTLAAKAGHNDGHHSHCDVGQFLLNIDGESLLPDAGRGLYSREYFRQQRYQNIFNNSYSHNVPRIGGQLQAPGPEFGGTQQYHGKIVEQGERDGAKYVVIDFHKAYNIPSLTLARRRLRLEAGGITTLEDEFAFSGPAEEIEEAFVTWCPVEVDGHTARLCGERHTLELTILEPDNMVFMATSLEAESRANRRGGVLTRLTVNIGAANRFRMRLTPQEGKSA
jgi:hypothetical protein